MAGVVQGGRHHGEPFRQRRFVHHGRRSAAFAFDATARAVRNQQLVVELRLRSPRFPGLARLEEDRNLVLVAVLIAGLDAHDVRHRLAVVGRGRGHFTLARRARGIVGFELASRRRLVFIGVGSGRVALGVDCIGVLAHPRLDLRSREHRPAVRVVDDRRVAARLPRRFGAEHVGTDREAREQALIAAVCPYRELARHVG